MPLAPVDPTLVLRVRDADDPNTGFAIGSSVSRSELDLTADRILAAEIAVQSLIDHSNASRTIHVDQTRGVPCGNPSV
jgi:hypothetical protein